MVEWHVHAFLCMRLIPLPGIACAWYELLFIINFKGLNSKIHLRTSTFACGNINAHISRQNNTLIIHTPRDDSKNFQFYEKGNRDRK